MGDRVTVCDATLAYAELTPGCGLNLEERLRMAHQLERLGGDIIVAGTPMASPVDFEAVRLVATTAEHCSVAANCRARKTDIDRAWEAIGSAHKPRLILHRETSGHLRPEVARSGEDLFAEDVAAVAYARSLCEDIEFFCDDAAQIAPDTLVRLGIALSGAGAKTITLAETTGYATPDEYRGTVQALYERIGKDGRTVLGTACANDLGLAVANTLVALQNGARQVTCALNGIGPRAGCASLEELVMLIRCRNEILSLHTGVHSEEIYKTSRLLSSLTGMPVQRNKPVVGANVFAQSAPTDLTKNTSGGPFPVIMTPQSIGIKHSTLVLGKHSDLKALEQRYRELGYDLRTGELDRAFKQFRQIVEQKKEILDEDLIAILEQEVDEADDTYHLENIQVHSGTQLRPTATVELRKGTEKHVDSATGDGPIDAAYKAIERITGSTGQLTEYLIKSLSLGRDGFGEVFVRVDVDGISFHGRGVSTDVITGSARAYLEALNRAAMSKKKRAAQP
jgi:2-isopropylmalate synthase